MMFLVQKWKWTEMGVDSLRRARCFLLLPPKPNPKFWRIILCEENNTGYLFVSLFP